ncbi:MAG: hypothetical protein V2I40_03730 [Desulfobacteraceae bacterium]|jgi:hypothetical protein|nr:hypothetical protein [Desulfobacteraceae bacterium]
MEINPNHQVRGLEAATKISDVKREKEDAPGRQAAQTEESPDYRIRLSDGSKMAVNEPTRAQSPGQGSENADLSEEDAAQVARQTAEWLSQTNLSITNLAMQKTVDLFT